MLKRSMPGRIRRVSGRVFVALAAVVVGYSAWAAEPATTAEAAATPANTVPSGAPLLTMQVDDTQLTFEGGDGKIFVRASRATTARAASSETVLDDVRLSTSPEWRSHATITPRGSPPEVLDLQALVVEAGRVVGRFAQERDLAWNFESGCVVKLTVVGQAERTITGAVCRLQGTGPSEAR